MKSEFLACSGLILAVFLAHFSAIQNEFYWDDRPQILEGRLIGTWDNLAEILLADVWENVEKSGNREGQKITTYRPFFNLSLMVDHGFWEKDPFGYHLSNFLFHLVTTLLLFLVLGKFFSFWPSFLSTLLFSIHALTLETVQYVSARGDSLFSIFLLGAILISFERRWKIHWRIVFSGFSFLICLLAKETALLFPLVFLTLAFLEEERPWKKVLLLSSPYFVAVGLYFLIRFLVLDGVKAVEEGSVLEVVLSYPILIFTFLQDAVWPSRVLPLQDFSALGFQSLGWPLTLSLYGTLLVLLVWAFWKRSFWLVSLLWVGAMLAPSTIAVIHNGHFGPRYFYPALLGMTFGLAELLIWMEEKWKKWIHVKWVAFLLILLFGVHTYLRSNAYRTEVSFYEGIIAQGPHALLAEYNLGNAWMRKDEFEKAGEAYRQVLLRNPKHMSALNNIGLAALNLGKFGLAEKAISDAIRLDPKNSRYFYNLALAQRANGKKVLALKSVRRALELDPKYEKARVLAKDLRFP